MKNITVGDLKKIIKNVNDDIPITIEINDIEYTYSLSSISKFPNKDNCKELILFIERN